MFATGFFGVPGSKKGRHTVHAVYRYPIATPLCGWKPSPDHQFQWNANRIVFSYIECKTCFKKAHYLVKHSSN